MRMVSDLGEDDGDERKPSEKLILPWNVVLPLPRQPSSSSSLTCASKQHCPDRDSKSGERGEHALAIFLPLLC